MTPGRIDAFLAFIKERYNIMVLRSYNQPWPWTADPILQQYRFCNVHRNDDKETRLIHQNWLNRYEDEDMWFAMCVARLVNWWPSLEAVGYPVPWNPRKFVKALDTRKYAGQKVFTGAYMVRADAVIGGTKAAYLAQYVLTPLWRARHEVRPKPGDTLDDFHRRLLAFRDMGSFMAAQVVADVKYANSYLADAEDWWTWAASGPGSRRGLNRVLGNPLTQDWKEGDWRRMFADLLKVCEPKIAAFGLPRVSGQDLQNCLCEFDKYERVRLGEGRPRSKYSPPVTNKGTQ